MVTNKTQNKSSITNILRRHVLSITTVLSQLILTPGISLTRILIIVFSPLANIILDVYEHYSNNYSKTNNVDDINIVPSNYESINIKSCKKYGEHNNPLFTKIETYINHIIRDGKNIHKNTMLLSESIDATTGKPLITLDINNYIKFKHGKNENYIFIYYNMEIIENNNNTYHNYSYIVYGVDKFIIIDFFNACQKYVDNLTKSKKQYALYKYTSNTGNNCGAWNNYRISLKKNFSNIFLSREIDAYLPNMIERFFNEPSDVEFTGQTDKLSFLLYGEPGCGKSSLPYTIANEYNKDIYNLDPNFFNDNHFPQRLRSIWDGIVLIEEIDTIPLFLKRKNNKKQNDRNSLNNTSDESDSNESDVDESDVDESDVDESDDEGDGNEGNGNEGNGDKSDSDRDEHKKRKHKDASSKASNNNDKIGFKSTDSYKNTQSMISCKNTYSETTRLNDMNTMLDILDGYCFLSRCIVIATTNHPEKIDPAFFRSGRFDIKIEFKHADSYQINNIFAYFYNGWKIPEKAVKHMISKKIRVCYIINTLIMPYRTLGPKSAFNAYARDYPDFNVDWLECDNSDDSNEESYDVVSDGSNTDR